MFDYGDICTTSPGENHQSDLGMIATKNCARFANAPRIGTHTSSLHMILA